MKKFITALLAAAVFAFGATQHADAANRILVYLGMNPDSNLQSLNGRFQRLQDGVMMRDLLGPLATTGAWSGLLITPATGLNVTINNSPSNQPGAIYQFGQDDQNVMPSCCSTESLPADSTNVVLMGYQPSSLGNPSILTNNANTNPSSSLGPLTSPGSGNVNYLIEAQLQSTTDTANNTYPFISTAGTVTNQNVPTQRTDVIAYQISTTSPGSNGGSCTAAGEPSADAGWIPVGWVCIPAGSSSVNPSNVVMDAGTNFVGASFGKVTFGGNFLNANSGNSSPSVLSTNFLATCGISNTVGAQGFVINNPSSTNNGGHILASDISGDLYICGSVLSIYNQQSNTVAPIITVNTPIDTGTSRTDTFYPASGPSAVYQNQGSCGPQSYCVNASGYGQICGGLNGAQPNAAFVTPTGNISGYQVNQITVTAVAGIAGFSLVVYNGSSTNTIAGGSEFRYGYVCL